MATRREFIRYITDEDLLDVTMTIERSHVTSFVVNYRANIAGAWREVVRYDNAHGQPLHVHRYWPPRAGGKDYLETEKRHNYGQALGEALEDLEAKWMTYRKKVEKHVQALEK